MPGGAKNQHAAQPAPGSCLRPDAKPPGTASSRRWERSSTRKEDAVNAMGVLALDGSKSFPRQRRELRPKRTSTGVGSISDLDNGLISTAPNRRRERRPTRTEAAAVSISDQDDDIISTAPSRRRERHSTHTSPSHTPHTHTHPTHPPVPPLASRSPAPSPPLSLSTHTTPPYPPWPELYPRVSWRQVFLPGGHRGLTSTLHKPLHPRCTPFTSPLHAPYTPSPQCPVVHRLRRAPPTIPKAGGDAIGAATMGLSHISLSCRQQLHAAGTSLTARWLTGQAESPLGVTAERDVDCPLDLAHSCWASLLPPPLPSPSPLPSPPHPPHPPTPAHPNFTPPPPPTTIPLHALTCTPHSRTLPYTHTHTRSNAPLCEAGLCSIWSHVQHLGL